MENQMDDIDLSKMAYIVPNLPRYEIDVAKFWPWWDSVTIPIKRIHGDSAGNGKTGYDGELWDGVTIWQKPEYQRNIVWKVNYHTNDELFGELIQRVLKELPWYDIHGITLWSNKKRIDPHLDGLPKDEFPSAPRIGLIDECDIRTFYLISRKRLKYAVPDLTTGSNLFLFNNQNYKHGAKAANSGKKILVRIDGPLIDPEGLKAYINNQIAEGARYEGME
jgi:hypothetical protein